ncbi:hypothetical protein [[Kitasatospora] papulosa]|uniref:hypothetical protein n=1 Tax=[Kitasatospora] papulosa TaxID=1464011 RepID=UPI00369774C3
MREHVTMLASSLSDNEILPVDLRDDRVFRDVVVMHLLAGQTPDTHPGLHRALSAAREQQVVRGGAEEPEPPDPQGFSSGGVVTAVGDLAVAGPERVGAKGFVSIRGGAVMLTATLHVIDVDTGDVLARSRSAQQYGDGTYLPVATDPAGALGPTENMVGCLQYTYQKKVGEPVRVEQVQLTAHAGKQPDPVVDHPVKTETSSRDSRIRIGLGRGTGRVDDVDYWFSQPQYDVSYAVPLVGRVEFLAEVMQPLRTTVEISGYLAREKGDVDQPGGGMKPIPEDQKVALRASMQAAGQQLAWCMPPATSKQEPGKPLDWGPLKWSSDETVRLHLEFSVELKGKTCPGWLAIDTGWATEGDTLDGVAVIPPLDFLYCCVAGDSLTLLHDGTETRLDAVGTEHVVRGAVDGAGLPVADTRAAPYHGPAVRISTSDGRSLVLTPNHPVLTPAGPERAGRLRRGDHVLVTDGTVPLTEAETIDYDGVLCNLSLDAPEEPLEARLHSMWANGIAVCDYRLQRLFQARRRNDPDRIRSVLDPMFHEDFRQYLARTAARD